MKIDWIFPLNVMKLKSSRAEAAVGLDKGEAEAAPAFRPAEVWEVQQVGGGEE